MRKSRVLLAGVAVAAAAAATSAFTASNDVSGATTVAGYGEIAATGATITNVHYDDTTTPGVIDSIVFTTSTSVDVAQVPHVDFKLKDGNGDEQVVGSRYDCSVAAASGGVQLITCDTTSPVLKYADFDLVALTVAN